MELLILTLWFYSLLRKTVCCCIASSLDRYYQGTTQSFYTAIVSSVPHVLIHPHNQWHGSTYTEAAESVLQSFIENMQHIPVLIYGF